MPSKQCANRGCPGLVPLGHGRFCGGCLAGGLGKDSRPSSARRLYGARWRKAAAAFLAAHPVAVDYFGEHQGVMYLAEVVDHIVPHRGDLALFWDESNWQGLTKRDHSRKTALEDGGFGHARRQG